MTQTTDYRRTIAREALDVHDDGCCTHVARCEMGAGLERIVAERVTVADIPTHVTERRRTTPQNPRTGSGRPSVRATEAQMNYIHGMLDTLASAPEGSKGHTARACVLADLAQREERHTPMDKATAHRVIDTLKPLANQARQAQYAADRAARPVLRNHFESPTPHVALSDGLYEMDGDVYRVKPSQAGRLYAMLLVIENGEGSFKYARSVINRLRPEHRMTLERASRLSVQYHFCVRCAKELTKESSIAQGMGDWCASRM